MDNGSSGGIGLLGVVIGAAIVIGLGVLFFNGGFGQRAPSTVHVELPKPGK